MWRHFQGVLHSLQWKANSESKVQVSQLVLKVSNRKIQFEGRKWDVGGNKVSLTCKGGSVVEHAEALVEETASGNILYKGEWIWGGRNQCRQNLFFSQARHILIMNLFPVYHKPISARKLVVAATKEYTFSRPVKDVVLVGCSASSVHYCPKHFVIIVFIIIIFERKWPWHDHIFSFPVYGKTRWVTTAFAKWPWGRHVPAVYALHNRKCGEKIVCSMLGEEGRARPSPHTPQFQPCSG